MHNDPLEYEVISLCNAKYLAKLLIIMISLDKSIRSSSIGLNTIECTINAYEKKDIYRHDGTADYQVLSPCATYNLRKVYMIILYLCKSPRK